MLYGTALYCSQKMVPQNRSFRFPVKTLDISLFFPPFYCYPHTNTCTFFMQSKSGFPGKFLSGLTFSCPALHNAIRPSARFRNVSAPDYLLFFRKASATIHSRPPVRRKHSQIPIFVRNADADKVRISNRLTPIFMTESVAALLCACPLSSTN